MVSTCNTAAASRAYIKGSPISCIQLTTMPFALKSAATFSTKLTAFLSKGGKIKVDGVEEDHKVVKGGDAAVAGSIAKWVLAM